MNIVEYLVIPLIQPILDYFSQTLFTDAFLNVFYFERAMGISNDVLNTINLIILGFASSLLTAKLLYKLLNIYIFKIDGDASTNPLEYVKGYVKGIIVTLCFTVIYNWLFEIVSDLGQQLLAAIGEQPFELETIVGATTGLIIFVVIYVIFICIIYIHFLMNGVRLFILRVGIPFACIGLIDNDNGIFSVFIKKIIQTSVTVLVQLILVQISILPIKTNVSFASLMISIAILSYSLKVTNDLTEIFASSAGSGMGSKAASLSRGVGNVMKFIKK